MAAAKIPGEGAFRRILAATDFSEIATEALRAAGALARELGAELVVCHVLDDRALTTGPYAGYVDLAGTLLVLRREVTEKAMPAAIENAGLEGLDLEVVVVQGRPVEAILEVAGTCGADMLALGTHGRSGFSRLFFGSVAERVVRLSPVPVLTVGAPDDARATPERKPPTQEQAA